MRRELFLTCFAVGGGAVHAKTAGAEAIEHVVLLVMENRPFDMFYGFAQPVLTGRIDGLTGKECFPTPTLKTGETPHYNHGIDIEMIGDDDDAAEKWGIDPDGDKDDENDGYDKERAVNIPDWGLDPSHPLDRRTQILYNTYANEDKYVSFAYTALPPGETDDTKHWLRATYTSVSDAMPVHFEAVSGTPDLYKLRNMWPGYEGYLCDQAQSGGSYMFMHTSCSEEAALPLLVVRNVTGTYTLQTTDGKYVSYCDSGCSGGRWVSASYTGVADAMTLKLSDPGVAPPPPPLGPPECVQNGAALYICRDGGPWVGAPPLGWNSSWDGFNPMCPGNKLPELCPGGRCPPLCTNGLGTVGRNKPCKWPFTYQNKTYDGNTGGIGSALGGYGLCSPYGGVYNGSYGGVKPCGSEPENTKTGFWAGCVQFPKTDHGGWLLSGAAPEAVHQFSPEQVPIHIKLAQEFALFDQYHISFPGPSTPNHLYLMTGTNAGCTETGQDFQCVSGKKYPQKTIFESLAEAGHEWRYYINDTR